MKTNQKTAPKKIRRILAAALACVLLLTGGSAAYVADYYRADPEAVAVFSADAAAAAVSRETPQKGVAAFIPPSPEAGFIFYPGGKVEAEAYIPLMEACAARGVLCLLTEMPLRLAVLDPDAAEGLPALYPQVKHWYIGGHSLGGAMASAYVSEHADAFAGIVLLGAYASADLSETHLRALCLYGSEDGVLNREKYEQNRGNLPPDLTETVIEGGCHAGFGAYGPQKGDGVPTISREAQMAFTAEAIAAFVSSGQNGADGST